MPVRSDARPDVVSLHLRLPKPLHNKLLKAAKGDSPPLSLHQVIVGRLERTFDDRPSPATMAAIKAAAQMAADAKSIQGLVEVFSDPDAVRYFIAKYPRFRDALVAALTTDDGRIIP